MIPILFEANETAFTTQGLGALADAVSVSVSRVINGRDELTMVYPSTGARYADILNDRIIYAVPEYKKAAQPYQIYKITKPMNGMVTVYARHVGSQRTGYIPVTPFTAGSLTETLNSLPNHLAESSPFTFWTNKTVAANFKLSRPASLGKVLGGMEGSILDVYGGEYEFDGYTIKLWQRRGTDSGVELRYAKNITDIEQSEDFASIITGVVPYWEGMDGTVVSLPEVVVEGQYADTYSFRRTIVKDFTESFEEEPTVADLRAAAVNYVSQSNIGVPEINLKVSFEHLAQYSGYENLQLLEKLNLGDTVSIFYEPLDVSATARIAKTTFDCLNEKYDSVQIGSVRSDLEQIMHTVSTNATQMKQTLQQNIPSALAEAVENATDLITGANGGYVVLDRDANGKPFQILIMDTDDKATATNVLRLNQNGIGFSTSGYSGPFSTAWTIDSNFVADYITTGTLNAALAKIGLLADAAGKNSWNMETGAFTITNGAINIATSSTSNDIINLNYNDGTNNVSSQMMSGGFSVRDLNNAQRRWYHMTRWGYYEYQDNANGDISYPIATLGNATLYLGGTANAASDGVNVGGDIYVRDSNGVSRTHIGPDGTLYQYDANGKTRTYLEYGDIMLYTSAEKQTAKLSGSAFGTGGSLQLYDTSAVERARLTAGGLSFYNSSGTLTASYPSTGLPMLSAASAANTDYLEGKVINVGLLTYTQLGIGSSASIADTVAAWLKYVCAHYTKAFRCIFEGTLNMDSSRMMRYFIYHTQTVNSNGVPQYASGQTQNYDGRIWISGTNNYAVYSKLLYDYITEYGNSNGWYWRKWAGGAVEMWKRLNVSIAVTSSWGNVYYGAVPRQTYPLTLNSSPWEIVSVTGSGGWAWIGCGDSAPSATQSGTYYLFRPTSATATFNIDFYVRGGL